MNATLRRRLLARIRRAPPAALLACIPLALSAWSAAALALDDSKAHPADAQATVQAGAVNERELGLADAVLEYCTQADPTSVDAVKARVKRAARGASAVELAKVREGGGYVRARRAESEFLSKVDPRNSARVCGGTKSASPPPKSAKAK